VRSRARANLFYNSPMEACVVICRTRKPADRRGKILFIDAIHEVARERAQSYLKPENQRRIAACYRRFQGESGFAAVVSTSEVLEHGANLSIPHYVRPIENRTARFGDNDLTTTFSAFVATGREFWLQMDALGDTLVAIVDEVASDV